jgi:1-acyl-sn-glycerol-3-phosphate acyltransferase
MLLRLSGAKVVIENGEMIDPERPQVLVANHVSWYDVLVLVGYVPGRSIFVAKKELESVPFFGPASKACGQIFIDRKDRQSAVQSLSRARKRLEEESPTIIMFPEGTRSATGELQPFKKGAFVLALQTGVDVIPAAIIGSREVMRKGSLLIHPGTIRVRFGDPISIEGLTLEDRSDLTNRAWQALSELQAAD